MNKLTVTHHEGIEVVDSREVARMIDKQHFHLLRDISGYVSVMENEENPKSDSQDFFLPSTYLSEQGKELPCYLLTKKGCDMVANKMTGEKGVIFTAAYVTAFEAMREHIASERPVYNHLSPQLQVLIALETEQKRQAAALMTVEQKVDGIREIVAIKPQSWRDECCRLLHAVAMRRGGGAAYKEVNAEAYQLVDERAGVSLAKRLTNKRRRMADAGVRKSNRDKLNNLDVIQDDKKLVEIFIAVVKELAIKYGVALPSPADGSMGA